MVRPSTETIEWVQSVVDARNTPCDAYISATVNARPSTGSPILRAASIAAPRVTPGRMRGPLGAVRTIPFATLNRFAFVASSGEPSLGRSMTLLMSQRPQRSSVTRMALPPSGEGGGSVCRAKANTVGAVPAGGNAWDRGGGPGEACAETEG